MTDYTKNVDYAAKDGLLPGDPLKVFYGADIDSEWAEIVTAIASKYDSADLSVAPVGTEDAELVTPESVRSLSRALSVVDTATVAPQSLYTTLDGGSSALDLSADRTYALSAFGGRNEDHSAIAISHLYNGISGGGDLTANRTIKLDVNSCTETAPVPSDDYLTFYDVSATDHKRVLQGGFRTRLNERLIMSGSSTTFTVADSIWTTDTAFTTHLNTGSWSTPSGSFITPGYVQRLSISAYAKFDATATLTTQTIQVRARQVFGDASAAWSTPEVSKEVPNPAVTGQGVSFNAVIDQDGDATGSQWDFSVRQVNNLGLAANCRELWVIVEALDQDFSAT